MEPTFRDAKQIWSERFETFLNLCFRVVSHELNKCMARRAANRGLGDLRWITPVDAVVAEALANLIIPSDDETPGMEDICVLGLSTLESLDRLVASSTERQCLYSRGLAAFDTWAQQECGCNFASMPREDQIRLLRASEQLHENWVAPSGLLQKAWRRFKVVIQGKGIPFSCSQLFPLIRRDCLQIFYTSRVSWTWLNYDGPPMDEGYPGLTPRR